MNAPLWNACLSSEYSIPFNHEEAHPAYAEGYYTFVYPGGGCKRNYHEEGSDSWYEWEDGYEQAYHNSLGRSA